MVLGLPHFFQKEIARIPPFNTVTNFPRFTRFRLTLYFQFPQTSIIRGLGFPGGLETDPIYSK